MASRRTDVQGVPALARLFLAAMVAAGALVAGTALMGIAQEPLAAGWLILAALGLVTGCVPVKVPGIETRFSLSDALVLTAVLLFGPERAAIIAGLDAVAASRFNRGDPLFGCRLLFNVAVAMVAIWVPSYLVGMLVGPSHMSASASAAWVVVLPLAGIAAGYSIVSTGAICMVLALTHRSSLRAVWRENFAWVWIAHAWSAVVAAAIAIYAPRVGLFSLLTIGIVAGIGYATIRTYLRKVEESTGRLHRLNDLYLSTIKALALAIDAKDQVTHGHIRRVQIYAMGLVRALGITDEATVKGMEAAALLHDTGKIAVPEHILNKPGKLTTQEFEVMKTHVTVGADILSGIQFPFPVVPFVRHHHENWDGKGYPDGLKGEQIPLGARILSVVDCFDALTSDRPYRRALSVDQAVAILRERSGTMYDSRVVDKFIEVLPALAASAAIDESPVAVAPAGGAPEGGSRRTEDAPVSTSPAPTGLPRLWPSDLLPEEIAFVVTNRLGRQLRFATCAVYVPRSDDDALDALYAQGPHADRFRHAPIRVGEGLSGWVAACGQTVVNANPLLDLRGPVAYADLQLASALVVPFTVGQGSRGALALYAVAPDAFTLDDVRVASATAEHLGRALGAAEGRTRDELVRKQCA
jgi:putative nucleotidyltransferase with HDIG domain